MKYIKIFLASSIVEFESERQQLASYINNLNNIYVRRGVYFELLICENLSTAMDKERKQDEYNRFICDSQYFYIILGQKAGDYTIEEFDTAWEQFKNTGAPRVNTFFYELPEDKPADKSVLDFMSRLDKELGHFYSRFTHLDSIKLNILLEFTRDPELHSVLKFEDGQAVLDGSPMLPLDNIPVYSKNEQLNQWKAELNQLDGEFADLADRYGKDSSLFSQMLKVGEQRAKLLENIHQWEMNVLDLYKVISDLKNEGRKLNWREKKAMELLDAGNYNGAIAMLRDPAWKKEVELAGEIIEAKKEVIHEYISGQKLRASTLKSSGITTDNLDEITECYEECVKLAEEHKMDLDVLFDYASFLCGQCDYKKGIKIAERLRSWYLLDKNTTTEMEADLFNLLGVLYSDTNCYSEAEDRYREALAIYCKLADENSSVYLLYVARAYNNLASLLRENRRYEEAMELYHEVLGICSKFENEPSAAAQLVLVQASIGIASVLRVHNIYNAAEDLYRSVLNTYRKLADDNCTSYSPKVAETCSNLAILLCDTNRHNEAEELYREALDISRKLANDNPSAYLPNLATICNNLANLLRHTNRYNEAEELYREALDIRRRLADENPSAYLPDVAGTCHNLANLLRDTNRYSESEELHREALGIHRRYADENPTVFLSDVARSCNFLADLLSGTNRYNEAEELYREALNIRRKLAIGASDANLLGVAINCNNLANLLRSTKRYNEAEELYHEALDIFRKLANETPDAYLPYMAENCQDYAILLTNTNRQKESIKLYTEALSIYRQFPHLSEKAELVQNILVELEKQPHE